MRGTALVVVSLLIGGMTNSTRAWAADNICKNHTPDPTIDARAKDLALLLLDGQPSFMSQWKEYILALHNGDDSAQDKANKEAELAIDMHCKDPQDVKVYRSADGKVGYDIDTWRVSVNESVVYLAATKDVSNTLALINTKIQGIPAESRDLYIADFNRNCGQANLAFVAIRRPDGSILVSNK